MCVLDARFATLERNEVGVLVRGDEAIDLLEREGAANPFDDEARRVPLDTEAGPALDVGARAKRFGESFLLEHVHRDQDLALESLARAHALHPVSYTHLTLPTKA